MCNLSRFKDFGLGAELDAIMKRYENRPRGISCLRKTKSRF